VSATTAPWRGAGAPLSDQHQYSRPALMKVPAVWRRLTAALVSSLSHCCSPYRRSLRGRPDLRSRDGPGIRAQDDTHRIFKIGGTRLFARYCSAAPAQHGNNPGRSPHRPALTVIESTLI
jgi:hypothetical protein